MDRNLVLISVAILVALFGAVVVSLLQVVEQQEKQKLLLQDSIVEYRKNIDCIGEIVVELEEENQAMLAKIEEQEQVIESLTAGRSWVAVEGVVTAYSPYDNVSGIENDGDPNKTSTGVKPGKGTIAVDPKRIPYGSEILIKYDDGEVEYGVAEDTGGAMRQAEGILIDVYRDTYKQVTRHGRRNATIFWKPREEK